MKDEKKHITAIQLEGILQDGDMVHTFRNTGNMLIGADWDKESVIKAAMKYEDTLELTGKMARGMGHGVALFDNTGPLFIETDENKLAALEKTL